MKEGGLWQRQMENGGTAVRRMFSIHRVFLKPLGSPHTHLLVGLGGRRKRPVYNIYTGVNSLLQLNP